MKCKNCPNFEKIDSQWLGLGICLKEEDCEHPVVYDFNDCVNDKKAE